MTIAMRGAGRLAKAPDIRTRKNGNQFVTATIRVQTSDGERYASITPFGAQAPPKPKDNGQRRRSDQDNPKLPSVEA